MGTLFEGFEILCTDNDYILVKRWDSIQRKTLYKGRHFSRKYGILEVLNGVAALNRLFDVRLHICTFLHIFAYL